MALSLLPRCLVWECSLVLTLTHWKRVFFVKVRTLSLPNYYCDSNEAYKISSNPSLRFEYFSNNTSPKNKLTTKLRTCEVPKFFIKKQKVSGTLPSAPAIQPSVLCSATTQTGAAGFQSGTHVYFVKAPSPTAGDPHHVARAQEWDLLAS